MRFLSCPISGGMLPVEKNTHTSWLLISNLHNIVPLEEVKELAENL
jgi:hypothetical protein